jgi:hypothetical protein
MNPGSGGTLLYSAGAFVAAAGAFLWPPLRAATGLVLKIVWLYFLTGMRG